MWNARLSVILLVWKAYIVIRWRICYAKMKLFVKLDISRVSCARVAYGDDVTVGVRASTSLILPWYWQRQTQARGNNLRPAPPANIGPAGDCRGTGDDKLFLSP